VWFMPGVIPICSTPPISSLAMNRKRRQSNIWRSQ
jgi:hypothetical protein